MDLVLDKLETLSQQVGGGLAEGEEAGRMMMQEACRMIG